MYNITIIFSMHVQIGNCNSNELYNIIKKENPEIIFEEFDILRTEDEYYINGLYKDQNGSTLETFAIMKYLEDYKVKYVPVDTFECTFFPKEMYKQFSQLNENYDKLFAKNILLAGQMGFQYLNCNDCLNIMEELHLIEENIIKKSKDTNLIHEYKTWLSITNNRDNEMLENIYSYSKNNKYNNAVFIIGAEHKKSIMEKMNEYRIKENIDINWRSWCIA